MQVIVAFAISVAAVAQRSTSHAPIEFVLGSDPVAFGLVDSIARPGGRITSRTFECVGLTVLRLTQTGLRRSANC